MNPFEYSQFNRAAMERGKRERQKRGKAARRKYLAEARAKGRHTATEWQRLVEFHCGRCVRCGCAPDTCLKDHIVPLFMGGSDSIENLQPMCRSCNSAKGQECVDFRIPGWREQVLRGTDGD